MAGGGGGDGLEDDDPLAVGSYSQLLFSDEVDDHLSADDCFNFTSSFSSENPPKMLCFGGEYVEELCDLGFDDDDDDDYGDGNSKKRSSNTTRNNNAPKAVVAAAVTCSDSSSTSSTNNNGDVMAKSLPKSNKKRNVSGLGGSDEQFQKNQNSDTGNNANEIKAPVMKSSQRNFKKSKSGNSSSEKITNCHAKVKKEKLGERILALQQLVSPFGKSDTASVLHEAMGYIRFLHDQVQVLCSPYLQKRLPSSAHLPQQEGGENGEGQEIEVESRKDLNSKGLCLVPLQLTVHVADKNGADFWSPAMVNGVSSNHS